MARTGMDPDDGQRFRPSAESQVTGTMFEGLGAFVGSQPRRGSEETADRVQRSKARVSKEHMVLERLARGPVTVDTYVQELRETTGNDRIERSSYAPRFTNLMNAGWAQYDDRHTLETSMGGVACPYAITPEGRAELVKRDAKLREQDAKRRTQGTFFGPAK